MGEFILGVAEEGIEPLAETLQGMELAGASGAEIDIFEADWVKDTKLMTCDEAVVKQFEAQAKS